MTLFNSLTLVNPVRNDPAALGPMSLSHMGTNKMTRLHTFEQWLEEADNRMKYIGTEEDDVKTILLKTLDINIIGIIEATLYYLGRKQTLIY